ncbi:hypothetical protein PsorP6_002543 [Peronosclerospora sorghi]|uniref:Uncharacterized protein n=1 Tax=Peronosclerospora sorghi TaxID=230839 RepID=A0ACC0WY59_9STRA|nr:hypothetical protein PsorP6_002543 [Peronosclerospora sorghi]
MELHSKETTRRSEAFEDRGMNTLADGYTVKDMMTLHQHYMSANSGNQLRKRVDLLIAHMMLMRGKIRRMLQIVEDIENEGPGACQALLCIMDQGKTNQFGKIESGTALRSKSPDLCAIGAIDFYLFYRFHIEKGPFLDFKGRKNWYGAYCSLLEAGSSR